MDFLDWIRTCLLKYAKILFRYSVYKLAKDENINASLLVVHGKIFPCAVEY